MGHPRFSAKKQEELKRLREEGVSQRNCAIILGVGHACVERYCKKLGLLSMQPVREFCSCGRPRAAYRRRGVICRECYNASRVNTAKISVSEIRCPGPRPSDREEKLARYEFLASKRLPLFGSAKA